ncbi:MAG: Asp-tRNA(Asn)/Glu-tRNA(Gln) amidotransferase subunit GatC, partial [Candidatus Pacebacteria bacterium]|nr:Asp-tRNA(Asn)/Glu-tRNA(Gln) amidotransferase subunit GatC [Candidatus Paceibacterota bacterium]
FVCWVYLPINIPDKRAIRQPVESKVRACYTSSMITPAELEKLATLARIKLTDADKSSLIKEFDSILGYVDQLKKVEVSLDTDGRVGAVKNVMRPDEVHSTSQSDREGLLDEAPHRVGDFIAVKKMIEQ